MNKDNRVAYIDSLRAILIFFVVFGHILEPLIFSNKVLFYNIIYFFHMPAFIFISGLCYKKNKKKLVKLSLIYIVFQLLYILINYLLFNNKLIIQFTTPIWILWYLLALIFWYLIVMFIGTDKKRGFFIIITSLILSILVGFDTTINNYFSLSRIIVFFPFFYIGAYIKNNYFEKFNNYFCSRDFKKSKFILILLLIICILLICIFNNYIESNWLYNSFPYNNNYNFLFRIINIFVASIFILSLLILIPKKNIKLLNIIGKNTLTIFLFHGIIIKFMIYINLFKNIRFPITFSVILTILIILLLSIIPILKSKKARN